MGNGIGARAIKEWGFAIHVAKQDMYARLVLKDRAVQVSITNEPRKTDRDPQEVKGTPIPHFHAVYKLSCMLHVFIM